MQKYLIYGIFFSILLTSCQQKVNWESSQWRGENRDGVYNETDLLKVWQEGGPQLVWSYEGLGDGYTSPAIANGKLYITGLDQDDLILFVFSLNGELLQKKAIGKEWTVNFIGPRGTINVNDGKLYIYNSLGHLICLDETTLDEVWRKDIITEFGGHNIRFGVTESPLIVDNKIFITPGGEEHNLVALNKKTGELIWSAAGAGTVSAYCSPQFISGYAVPMLVTCTRQEIVAFDANTGEMLWSHPQPSGNTIHPNTPLYHDGMIFSITGYGGGSWLYKLANNGKSAELVWHNDVDNQMGGAIKVGDYVYASGHRNRGWAAISWKTGEVMYRVDEEMSNGTIIYADGMLYIYCDRGNVALVRPNPEKFDVVSKFSITLGTNEHWAHPVINNGILYIRHGDALMAYKIK
jgi:outer membrane protein assembly factor BamB